MTKIRGYELIIRDYNLKIKTMKEEVTLQKTWCYDLYEMRSKHRQWREWRDGPDFTEHNLMVSLNEYLDFLRTGCIKW